MRRPPEEKNIADPSYSDIDLSSFDGLLIDTAVSAINAAYIILYSILVLSGSSGPGLESKVISSAGAILNASDTLISSQLKAPIWGMIIFRC